MKIKIPHRLAAAWDAWEVWVNVPVWREVRRIDLIMAAGFVFCVSYYWWTSGWQGALMGGIMYAVMTAVALWLL